MAGLHSRQHSCNYVLSEQLQAERHVCSAGNVTPCQKQAKNMQGGKPSHPVCGRRKRAPAAAHQTSKPHTAEQIAVQKSP